MSDAIDVSDDLAEEEGARDGDRPTSFLPPPSATMAAGATRAAAASPRPPRFSRRRPPRSRPSPAS